MPWHMAGRCELGFEIRLWGFRGHNLTGILQGVQAMVSVFFRLSLCLLLPREPRSVAVQAPRGIWKLAS